MENEKSLFDLQLDSLGKSHLKEAARWARFLSIAGFVSLGLVLLISAIAALTEVNSSGNNELSAAGYTVGTVIGTGIMLLIFFFPCYFLLLFANKMNRALAAEDAASLNEAFKNLKITLRYVGVVTIIFIALFVIGALANLSDW
jgi:amino acid transporter